MLLSYRSRAHSVPAVHSAFLEVRCVVERPMRELLQEEDDDNFRARRLLNPPLVYVWIPVGVVCLVIVVCLLRSWLKPRRAGATRHTSSYMPTSSLSRLFVILCRCLHPDALPQCAQSGSSASFFIASADA